MSEPGPAIIDLRGIRPDALTVDTLFRKPYEADAIAIDYWEIEWAITREQWMHLRLIKLSPEIGPLFDPEIKRLLGYPFRVEDAAR